ncbi:MAG: DUF58 domain-containing protein [Treponema sp.]|nr:MAG: DUF58 domain-containing protein [Treponema sp.]
MKKNRLADRAKFLKLASISVSQGMRAGIFSSKFRGRGIEFDSVREYEFDDDVRTIDWNLTARSGKAFVKLYREERDLNFFLLVDSSASMHIKFDGVSVFEKALDVSGLLLFAAYHSGCPVGAIPFAGTQGKALLPQSGEEYVLSILSNIENFAYNTESQIKGTAMSKAIAGASRFLRGRAMVIIISDFKVAGYADELATLSRKHDCVAIRIISPFDYKLPPVGVVPFVDSESNMEILAPTGSVDFQNERMRNFSEELVRWKNMCIKYGVLPLEMPLKADSVQALTNFFLSAKNKREFLNNLKLGRNLV